jgi:hypothetical protein
LIYSLEILGFLSNEFTFFSENIKMDKKGYELIRIIVTY